MQLPGLRAGKSIALPAVLAALGATLLQGCATGPGARDASEDQAWSIERARILFTGRRGALRELYILDRATGHAQRLTFASGENSGANGGRISRDGQSIAFQVREGRDYEIHVMSIGGGSSVNVSRHPDFDVLPTWSPDGRQVAFMSTRGFVAGGGGPFPGHIYVTSLDGAHPRQVTKAPMTSSLGPSDWSADGKTMLLARAESGRPDLFLLDVQSGTEHRLTDTPEGEYSAVFSRDGRRVAFHSESEGESQIEVMGLDGTGRRALTSGPGFRYYPRWSPDDQWILFTESATGDQYDLRAVHLDSGRILDLVVTPEDEREGEWLPAPGRLTSR